MRNYSIRPRDDGRAAKRVLAMPLARTNGWFDDEIAIDFPSLHAAVERMRACFVAASAECDPRRRLSTELHLSPREAFNGVTVPLDVPGSQAVSLVRRARRNLVGSVRRVRWQRRSARPPSRASRRPAARPGRRSICPLGFRSVRSAHARRSARRIELNSVLVLGAAVLRCRFSVPGSGSVNREQAPRTSTQNPQPSEPRTVRYSVIIS